MCLSFFFFFNDTATTEIYTLSLHDALPILFMEITGAFALIGLWPFSRTEKKDRKSTRLNSSHRTISYAVFCLKKKKKQNKHTQQKQQHNKTNKYPLKLNTPTCARRQHLAPA